MSLNSTPFFYAFRTEYCRFDACEAPRESVERLFLSRYPQVLPHPGGANKTNANFPGLLKGKETNFWCSLS